MVYLCCITTTRMSVLLFLRRIFYVLRSFRWAVAVVAGIVVANGVVAVVLYARQCAPDRNLPGEFRCVDVGTAFMLPIALGILADLIIVALPLPVVWRLQLSPRRRAGLVFVFLLGLLYVLLRKSCILIICISQCHSGISFCGSKLVLKAWGKGREATRKDGREGLSR
jgi:hypothetical protein